MVLEGELSPYRVGAASNVRLLGEQCVLPGSQIANVALVVHELATNAAKYGALSSATGHVEVRWRAQAGILHLRWKETGGPTVAKPAAVGFGSELIRRLLGPGVRLQYLKEGLRAWLRIPLGK